MDPGQKIVAAFSADQAAELTGLTKRQLAYWDSTGFFTPRHASENRRSPFSRIYSFSDIVGLRTISLLKNGHGVTMRQMKDTAAKLSKYTKRQWSQVKLAVWNREVTWIEPDTGKPAGVLSGQYILFELIHVIDEMRREAEKLRTRESGEWDRSRSEETSLITARCSPAREYPFPRSEISPRPVIRFNKF
jgi:DNA-binding transcriptional MerR regulator